MSLETYRCPECGCRHYGRKCFGKQVDSVCFDCHEFALEDEVQSSKGIRCPHCGDITRDELGEIGLYEEGCHEVYCGECGKSFEVTTYVEMSWLSPERIPV